MVHVVLFMYHDNTIVNLRGIRKLFGLHASVKSNFKLVHLRNLQPPKSPALK